MRHILTWTVVALMLIASACTTQPLGTEPPVSPVSASTTDPGPAPSSTTGDRGRTATIPFTIPVGEGGVTYDLGGEPPSGPSSFVVLEDGTVVIADTMALRFDEPRLLRFDASGAPLEPITLADAQVASIVDVASDGERIAVLDVYPATNRYRVLVLATSGRVESVVAIPEGFFLEDGLTGLAWDDIGLLLEMEWGAHYGRVTTEGPFTTTRNIVYDGSAITVAPGAGFTTVIAIGSVTFAVERTTELGGASLIGLAPDGSVLLVVDEVGQDGQGAIEVTRRVQRRTTDGRLLGEDTFLAGQFVSIGRELEMTADGRVARLVTFPDRVEFVILDV